MDDPLSTVEKPSLKSALRLHFRILTFQATREELAGLGCVHLALGLAWTWLVGIGRWWDDPGASIVQHLGLGSVAYVFILSLVLWLFALPMRPRNFTYFRTLTYVTLTSPPALLYAIPMERWYGVYIASDVNVCFLGVVALWRFALYCTFLSRATELPGERTAMAALLPIMLTVVVLTMLNLERATFEIMGGLRAPKAADQAYATLILMSLLSMYGSVLAVPLYLWEALRAHLEARRSKSIKNKPVEDSSAGTKEIDTEESAEQ